MCERFLASLNRALNGAAGRGARRRGRMVTTAALLSLFAAVVLAILGLALQVQDYPPTAMPDLVRGADASGILEQWVLHGVVPVAWAYLLVDTCVFLPAYVFFALALAVRLRDELIADQARRAWRHVVCIAVLITFALAAADVVENLAGMAVLAGVDLRWIVQIMLLANRAKAILAGVVGLALFLLLLAWYFNRVSTTEQGNAAQRSSERARLRIAAADIVWRTRYTIALIVLFAALTIGLDQGQDVVIGIAQFRSESWVGMVLIFAITAIAIFAFSYSTWMWSRLMLRATRQLRVPQTDPAPAATEPSGIQLFARWWARILGTLPLFIAMWLCGLAMRDAIRVGAGGTAVLLGLFAMGLLLVAVGQLGLNHRKRTDALDQYYDAGYTGGFFGEIAQPRYTLFGAKRAPILLPLSALAVFALLRGTSIAYAWPLAVAVLALAVTVWIGLLGWIAQHALRNVTPWVLILFLVSGVLGAAGCTDNHVVRMTADVSSTDPSRVWFMFAAQAALASFVVAGLGAMLWRGWRTGDAVLVVAGVALTLYWADARLSEAHNESPLPVSSRPKVDVALARWLDDVCASIPACVTANHADANSYPVYFVSSEGGGVRAAYWTALVLAQLNEKPEFARRTFSLSGVSGGAVGEAVWSACLRSVLHGAATDASDRMTQCIASFGSTDLLTPLLAAMLFEDVLARWVPTSWCKASGCGFLDRGVWFELTMERGVAALGGPLGTARPLPVRAPHLFLNSTWVETGERAIASDVVVDWTSFPTARDQLNKMGSDIPLSTAAHNAARFPYANALGAIRPWTCSANGRCQRDAVIGHLADGGYFDNSSANTTTDILRALERCLIGAKENNRCMDEPSSDSNPNAAKWTDRLQWLREHLVPQVIMIRNGLQAPLSLRVSEKEACRPGSADPLGTSARDPAAPRCAGRWQLYSDFAGPAVAAFNAGGTGANGRLAESRLEIEVQRVRMALRPGAVPQQGASLKPVAQFYLVEEKILFPLGWYLSSTARAGMQAQLFKQDWSQVAAGR
jgi:hypothetical protein